MRSLEDRWSCEVEPRLIAAAVADLDGLEVKIAEAQEWTRSETNVLRKKRFRGKTEHSGVSQLQTTKVF